MCKSPLKQLLKYLRHGPFVLYWIAYDYLLTAYVRLMRIDFIGKYIRVMSNSERKFFFKPEDTGHGYNAYTIIKIGFDGKHISMQLTIDMIVHEVIHQVLYYRVDENADDMFDTIHKGIGYRIDFVS